MKKLLLSISIVLLAVLEIPASGNTSALADGGCTPISVTTTGDTGPDPCARRLRISVPGGQ